MHQCLTSHSAWPQPNPASLPQVFGDQAPNHVLINAYRPGEGIMPHEDGPMYWPGVCILSLAAPAVIRFRRKRAAAAADDVTNGPPGDSTSTPPQRLGRPAAAPDLQDLLLSLLLMPRSLLVFTDDAYSGCLHGIDFTEVEELDTSVANLAACGLTASTSAAAGNPSGATSAFDSATSAVDDSDMGALPTTAPLSSDNGVSEGRNVGSANGEVVEAFDSAVQHSQQPAQPSDDAASASGRDDVAAARPPSVLPRGGERVSLTVRRVLKVFNNLIKTK